MSSSRIEGRPQRCRRRVALVGVFAVLFQALLFGWHHHELGAAARGSHPTVTVSSTTSPLSPVSDEDECDICMALHHLSAAPGEFVSLPVPPIAASTPPLPILLQVARASEHAFHARAPPRASDHPV